MKQSTHTSTERPRPPAFAKAILVLCLVILYIPFFSIFFSSFVSETEEGHFLTLQWFQSLRDRADLFDATVRSIGVSIAVGLITCALGTFAAVGFSRIGAFSNNGRGSKGLNQNYKKSLFIQLHLALMAPEIVFALSCLIWFGFLHFSLGLTTVIIAHICFCLPYAVFTINSRLELLDPTIEDAARDLGASNVMIFAKIILPNLRPALLSAFILCSLLSFDDFLISFFVNGVGSDTLPIKIYTSMRAGASPILDALTVLIFLTSGFLMVIFRPPNQY